MAHTELTFINELGREKIITVAKDEDEGRSVKDFLRASVSLSATLIKKVKYGGVLINGTAVTMRAVLHSGDVVEIVLPTEQSEHIEPILRPIKILYEDEHILAVDKEPNMPVHPSRANHLVTLANAVMAYMGEPFVFRAVNRLDRDTSGIVIIAKHQYAASLLSDEMKHGGFQKHYTALLERAPEKSAGIIDAPIERECEGSIKRVVREGGKRAVTEYKVREILPDGRAICDIKLHTGRTHQIRVHMAYAGAPLWADFLYGTKIEGEIYSLCCTKIEFTHPVTMQRMCIEAGDSHF